MTIGKVLMTLALSVSMGINVYPLRVFFFELFDINKESGRNIAVSTFFITLVPVAIASVFKNITNYMGLAGALSVTLI